MLDHREIFPIGTFMGKNSEGKVSLYIYGKQAGQKRVLASLALKRGFKTWFGIPDITNGVGATDILKQEYSAEIFRRQDVAHQKNQKHIVHKEFPASDVAVIIAPGRTANSDASNVLGLGVPIITVNRANDVFPLSDYTVICDCDEQELINVKDTVGVLCTHSYPGIAELGWKDTTWFTHLPRRLNGIPYSYPTEGVITDALWFAINGLKAKKVIMLGVEQPITHPLSSSPNYFWEGIFLQAHCYWYSKSGIEIWNCTPATSVVAGVILGTLEEACQ